MSKIENGNFKPRESEEKVKNCTKVPKTVIGSIVHKIVEKLLETQIQSFENGWNPGRKLHLSEIPSFLDANLLQELKSECGGLQTLLRNHNHIFIVDKGHVRLRNPAKDSHQLGKRKPSSNAVTEKYRKTKPCWFFHHHPDGCPAQDCHWIHEEDQKH